VVEVEFNKGIISSNNDERRKIKMHLVV